MSRERSVVTVNDPSSRRWFLRATAGTGLATGLGSGASAAARTAPRRYQQTTVATNSDWPMFQHDAANSGTLSTTGPSEPVEAVWTFETDGGLRAQPVVDDGTVYLTSTDSRVYAVSAADGSREWSIGTNGGLNATPAVADGILYVPTNNGSVLALSSGTGSGQWTANVPRNNVSSVTLYDGNVIVTTDGDAGHWGSVTVFDGGSGDRVMQDRDGYFNHDVPLVHDGSMYVLADNGWELSKYNTSDWSRQWLVESGNHLMTAHGGTVYLTNNDRDEGHVRALDAESGETQWTFTNVEAIGTRPVYYDGTLYVTSTPDNRLHAIDPSIGTRRWQRQVGGTPTSPVAADGMVYFGADDNRVYGYDAQSGERRFTFTTGGSIVTPPTVLDETIYVSSADGTLYALREEGSVSPGDVTGDGAPAQDLDEDGLYEDVNGDGAFTIVDVQALFANLDSDTVQNNAAKFDFNGDGVVDVTDVQALYARLNE